MTNIDKLTKLQQLRKRREAVSLSSLLLAKHDRSERLRTLERARRNVDVVHETNRTRLRKALRDAEDIRDSGARFAGIAMTLRRNSDRVEAALDEVEESSDRVSDADDIVEDCQQLYRTTSRDRRQFDHLQEKFVREINAAAEYREEEDIAELAAVSRKVGP